MIIVLRVIFYVLLFLMFGSSIYGSWKRNKEIKMMTVDKFVSKAESYRIKKDSVGFSRFCVTHLGFYIQYKSEIDKRLGIDSKESSVDLENK